MNDSINKSRKALETELCSLLGINRPQASMLIERMLDFFKDMRVELRKADDRRNTH